MHTGIAREGLVVDIVVAKEAEHALPGPVTVHSVLFNFLFKNIDFFIIKSRM